MKSLRLKILCGVIFIILAISVSGKNGVQLFYLPSGKPVSYNTYLEGTLTRKAETRDIHLQFTRNWQLNRTKEDKYVLQEWVQKYQGSDFELAELGLPEPEIRVEKIMDRLGRIDKVNRYPKGHRYYLGLIVFPDHPVSAGNSWKYEDQLEFDFFGKSAPANCSVIYQLEKILVYRKYYRCAKILINGSCQSIPGSELKLDYRFNGKVFFDMDTGREIDYQLNYSWFKSDPSQNLQESARLELYSILEK